MEYRDVYGVLCVLLSATLASAAEAPQPPGFETERTVYVRGELATLTLHAPDAERVAFDVDGWLAIEAPVLSGKAEYAVDTTFLRAGDYLARARLIRPGAADVTIVFPLTVAKAFDRERMPVWRWGGGGGNMTWWLERGFTGGWLSSCQAPADKVSADTVQTYQQRFEDAARYDFELGFYFNTLISSAFKENDSVKALFPDGTRSDKVYPFEPDVVQYTRQVDESWMKRFKDYPGLRHVMFNSEWQTPYCVNETAAGMLRDEMGLDIRDFVKEKGGLAPLPSVTDGLIDDNLPAYRFLQWWWQRGHGMAPLNEIQNGIVKQYRPDVLTWHEPYRLAPVRYSHKGLDCIATWTYGAPDIKRLCYTTYLQAAARPEHQRVQQDITLFVYGRFVMPLDASTADYAQDSSGKDPYFTAGADYAREATWLVVSQRPDLLCFYSAGSLSPTITTLDPFFSSPETYDAIGETCNALVKPYGPAILGCTRVAPHVALLMSAAAAWFRSSDWLSGYENEKTLPYATLLMRNHVPFDVLLDEDILEGALDRYDVLVMPKADTLLRSEHERICAFASQGGKVIANNELRAAVPGAQITTFDFTHWNRMNGEALAKGNAVTAEEDRDIMEGYARDLAPLLAGVPREADAASPRVLTNSLAGGDVRYHFFINDDQTYGPRFGEWKLRFELGRPQTAELSVAVDGRPALYDALEHKRIEYTEAKGRAVFKMRLPGARGKLIAALPEPIARIEATAPETATPGTPVDVLLRVVGESGNVIKGVMPLQVEVTDPARREDQWGHFTSTEDGETTFRFTPAANDAAGTWTVRATDLIAGHEVEAVVRVNAQ